MTRVLHVLGGLNRGGAETWVMQVLHQLQNKDVQIDFVVNEDGPFQYQAEAEALGSRIFVCRGLSFPPLYAGNLLRILKTYGPYQVLHSHIHYFSGVTLLVAAAAGVPVRVVQSHLDTRSVDATARPLRRLYTGVMKRLIWQFATVGTAVSKRAADALFPPDWDLRANWKVMLLGVDLEPFLTPVDGQTLRRELGIPADATVVGHVGRFDPQKNHAFLLRVAAEYLKMSPRAVFLLVGEGLLRADIEAEANRLGIASQVRLLGARRDVPALMRGVMDIFMLPSLFEGLPLVLLEAQAAGLPCLISDTIAEETDLAPSLIHRESLASPAATWANRLQNLTQTEVAARNTACLELVAIGRSVQGLLECYAVPNTDLGSFSFPLGRV